MSLLKTNTKLKLNVNLSDTFISSYITPYLCSNFSDRTTSKGVVISFLKKRGTTKKQMMKQTILEMKESFSPRVAISEYDLFTVMPKIAAIKNSM